MQTRKTSASLLISFLFIFISVSPGLTQSANPQKPLSIEGEWEQVSASSDPWRANIGKRMVITRRGDGYEVKWSDAASGIMFPGNETRLVRSFLEDRKSVV